MATPLGFVDASDDGSAPPPEYGDGDEEAPYEAPPMDDDGPPEAPPMDDGPPPKAPMTMLGDLLRAEGSAAKYRKQQLREAPKAEKDPADAMRNELAAAIAKRKEALAKVPTVEKKKEEKKSELQNTILLGIASLRKVEKRRDSMDKSKGTRPEKPYVPGQTVSKWKPKDPVTKADDGDLSTFKFRCGYCKMAITNLECVDTPNGMFHVDCFRCQSCEKQLLGEYLTVNGAYFHPECLNCCKCLNSLIDQPLLCSNEKKLYCSSHTPRDLCFGCGERIEEGRVIQLTDRNWHEKCFVCVECRTTLAGKMYVTHEGQFYCKPDYARIFAVTCARCGGEADGPCYKVSTPDGSQLTVHKKCYTCRKCGSQLAGKGSYAHQGDVYCKPHYDALQLA